MDPLLFRKKSTLRVQMPLHSLSKKALYTEWNRRINLQIMYLMHWCISLAIPLSSLKLEHFQPFQLFHLYVLHLKRWKLWLKTIWNYQIKKPQRNTMITLRIGWNKISSNLNLSTLCKINLRKNMLDCFGY